MRVVRFWANKAAEPMLPKHRLVAEYTDLPAGGKAHFIDCACGLVFVGRHEISPAIARERALAAFYDHCLAEGEA